jgi:hypothetical protein
LFAAFVITNTVPALVVDSAAHIIGVRTPIPAMIVSTLRIALIITAPSMKRIARRTLSWRATVGTRAVAKVTERANF